MFFDRHHSWSSFGTFWYTLSVLRSNPKYLCLDFFAKTGVNVCTFHISLSVGYIYAVIMQPREILYVLLLIRPHTYIHQTIDAVCSLESLYSPHSRRGCRSPCRPWGAAWAVCLARRRPGSVARAS